MPGATVQTSSVQRVHLQKHAHAHTVHKGKEGGSKSFTVKGVKQRVLDVVQGKGRYF